MRPSQIVWRESGALIVNDAVLIPAGDPWSQKISYGYIMRPWELKYTKLENAKINLFCILL